MHPFTRMVSGYRDDVDLQGRWWHRLISVVYSIGFGLVALVVAWLITADTKPEARVENVTVSASLRSLFDTPNSPSTNLAQLLADIPGEVGIRRPDGRIDYLNEYYLDNSFCSKHALEAPEALAEHFNKTNFTNVHTATSVLAGMLKDTKPGEDGLCWFHKDLSDDVLGEDSADIISYQFTASAKGIAWSKNVARAAVALFALHVLLLTFYHRGFVYIVCGPRRKPRPIESTAP